MTLLSHYQIAPLLKAHKAGAETAQTTPDLGLTTVTVTLTPDGIQFPAGALTWAAAREIADDENGCFVVEAPDAVRKIQVFSETTRRNISLYPTTGAPTMLIAGLPMHRIKNTEPLADTGTKIRAAAPRGHVLDTTTGLGYTAIEAARTAQRITTIELDPGVVEVAAQNPYSQALFDHPRIERHIGDSLDLVPEFPPETFNTVIHDPPMITIAGDLYSGAFYRELYRILAPGGRLFHYIGDLNSPSGARTVTGVLRRLGEAGFTRLTKRPEAFGVTAQKR